MFLRVKKVKGREYSYLVENTWKKGSARQRVRKYVGIVFRFESAEKDFVEFYKICDIEKFFKRKDAPAILRDAVQWELAKAGFVERNTCFEKDDIAVYKNMTFRNGRKKAVLALNQGYLCDFTLKNILKFKRSGDIKSDSIELARRFVDAGLDVPKEVFIAFFRALE